MIRCMEQDMEQDMEIEQKTTRVPIDVSTQLSNKDGWHVVSSCVVPTLTDDHRNELLLVLEREVPDGKITADAEPRCGVPVRRPSGTRCIRCGLPQNHEGFHYAVRDGVPYTKPPTGQPTAASNQKDVYTAYQNAPAFTGAVHEKVCLGKYTREFADLTVDQLIALLWLLGEYTCRTRSLTDEVEEISPGGRRRVRAHTALLDFARSGKSWTRAEVSQLMHDAAEGR